MRALIYHRVSAAHHGESVEGGLERLRRHVEQRGWQLAGEFSDSGPRHDTVRPGLRQVRDRLAAGTADAVVVEQLFRLFPSAHAALLDFDAWLSAGRHLVSLDDLVDTTRPADSIPFRAVLQVLARFEIARHKEATLIGILRAQLARHGRVLGPGRPTVAVDLLELQYLWARGLSLRAMVKEIQRSGVQVSRGTVSNRLALLERAGKLDHEARARARAGTPP